MSDKGGGGGRQVSDYLMSIDYGVCFGPVDHFNKIWIKDKTVLCDLYYTRIDVEVNMPELFGGDDGEGGVVGTVEIYTGTDDQFTSWELAKRNGSTPGDFPGYRGLAHIFFRGLRDWSEIEAEIADAGLDPAAAQFMSLKTTLSGVALPDQSIGWKWGSNNPYLPPVKASVTRLPRQSAYDQFAAIWPPAGVDDNGNLFGLATVEQASGVTLNTSAPEGYMDIQDLAANPNAAGGVIDLYSLGFTQAQIDNGEAVISAKWQITLTTYQTYGIAGSTLETEVRFHAAEPQSWNAAQLAPIPGEESAVLVSNVVTPEYASRERGDVYPAKSTFTESIGPVTAPPGCRYVQARAGYILAADVAILSPTESQYYNDEIIYDQYGTAYAPGSPGRGEIEVTQGPPQPPTATTEVKPPDDTFRPTYNTPMTVTTTPPTKLGDVVDLYELGYSQADIDAGIVKVRSEWSGTMTDPGGAVPYTPTNVSASIKFHATEPTGPFDAAISPVPEENDGRDSFLEGQVGSFRVEIPLLTVPPGARYVQFRAAYTTYVGGVFTLDYSAKEVGYLSYGVQHCATDDLLGPLPDANPSNIVWECMTNTQWGKGEPESMMNAASFSAAAETLYNERFGLSLAFFQQDTIENFIREVLDHIQAFLFLDPGTGLWTLKLLRDDYDPATLKTLDETNCVATNRKRRLWGETVNEIVVAYTDPNSEKEATVTAQDLGNIAIQGGVVSETRNYYGIRNPHLAQVVANRDVRAASYPLFSCRITVDRREWDARPGDVRKFSWAEDGVSDIVVRVMNVEYGKPGDRKIVLDVVEDIFSVDSARAGNPQPGEWNNVEQAPTPVDAQTAFTVPLPALLRMGESLSDIDANYPVVRAALFADDFTRRPDAIEVHTKVTKRNGRRVVRKVKDLPATYSGILPRKLKAETTSTIHRSKINGITGRPPEEGDFYMIGYGERLTELVMLESYDKATKRWTIARGMWDTVPLEWPKGTRIWAFNITDAELDPIARSASETVTYNLLPRTALGVLPFSQSVSLTATYTERPFAPFRPANVQIEGMGFGAFVDRSDPPRAGITVSWDRRNRTTEDQVALKWDAGDATPEPGQTTVLVMRDDLGNKTGEIVGISGVSYSIPGIMLPASREGFIEFFSERDGIRSAFAAWRYFDIRPPGGYGKAYGLDYGAE